MLHIIRLLADVPQLSQSWTTVALLIATAVCGVIAKLRRRCKISRHGEHLVDKLPGPKAIPIIGNCLDLWVQNTEFCNRVGELGRKFNGLYRLWYLNTPWVMVTSADACQQIFSKSCLKEKSDEVAEFRRATGTATYSQPGSTYLEHKRLVKDGYGMQMVKKGIDKHNYHSTYFVNVLGAFADSGKEFNLTNYALTGSIRYVWDILFDKKFEEGDPEPSQFIEGIYRSSLLFTKRLENPLLRSDFFFHRSPGGKEAMARLRFVNSVAKKYVHQRYEQWKSKRDSISTTSDTGDNEENQSEDWTCFVDSLFPAVEKGLMPLERVCNEFNVFSVAGYETTANVLATTLLLLGSYPEHQERIVRELNEVLGKDFDIDKGSISLADLKEMKYLELCLKEGLRLHPPIPLSPRKTTEDVHLGDGITIPKDVQVLIWNHWSHRDPKYFPEPEAFIPERFLPENPSFREKGPHMYFPFGVLPRNCVGHQIGFHSLKMSLAYLVKAYKWEAVTPREKLVVSFQYVNHPKNVVVKIKRR